MKFDAKSVVVGFLLAIVLVLLWRLFSGQISFYTDLPEFQENMSPEAAKALYDSTYKKLTGELDDMMKQAKDVNNPDERLKILNDGQKKLNEFTSMYNQFISRKQKEQSTQDIPQKAPEATPAPASVPTPAPAPEVVQAPAVSTYEPEPF